MSAEPFVVMAKPVGPVCNLDCAYCYYLDNKSLFAPGERYRMGDGVLEAHVRSVIEASPGPVVPFAWHGGEPTLAGVSFYRRVVELQASYLPAGWSCLNNLQTNGTLLDERWCAFLAEERFSVGISIDGPAQLHDALRHDRHGRPTHARVMRGLRLLRAQGIDPDVLCTLNALTAAHPIEVYRFFLDEGVHWLQFLPVVKGAPGGAVSEHSVGAEAMGAFLCSVFDEWVRHDIGRIAVQGFVECLRAWSGQPTALCTMAETCGRVPAMEHDGSVYACDHFVGPAHRLGDVVSGGIGALIDAPGQVAFGDAKRDGLTRACRECPVLFACHGGCPKDRFAIAPDGETGHNYLCAGYRRFYEHIGPYMQTMAALARRGKPVATIMGQIRQEEAGAEVPWRHAGRNDPCPCNSGRKYKHCCLRTRRSR
ncbi:MAG: anaerobic sulfatase maturase [Acidimicrobiales bacterium]